MNRIALVICFALVSGLSIKAETSQWNYLLKSIRPGMTRAEVLAELPQFPPAPGMTIISYSTMTGGAQCEGIALSTNHTIELCFDYTGASNGVYRSPLNRLISGPRISDTPPMYHVSHSVTNDLNLLTIVTNHPGTGPTSVGSTQP